MTKSLSALLTVFALLSFAAAAQAEDNAAPTFKFYGIIKTAAEGAYGAPESFGNANFSAVTNAAHPVTVADRDAALSSFQVAQTRFGFMLGAGSPVVAKLELDFIDFGKSTPTLTSLPRLRVASIDWKISAHNTLSVGQQWDLFAHIQPHHWNIVGAHFTAGNLSFMRDQIIWLHQRPKLELGFAAGLPNANGQGSIGNIERSLAPTLSARAAYKPNEQSAIGVSAIGTSLRLTDDDRLTVYGAALYTTLALSARLELRAEAYYGQNLANIGQLTLATGRADADLKEVGGWLSVKHKLTQAHSLALTAGMAQIINAEDLLPGYLPATMTTPATRALGQGLGLERNAHVRLSWTTDVGHNLKLMAEPYWLMSKHKLNAQDQASFKATTQTFGAQAGLIYPF